MTPEDKAMTEKAMMSSNTQGVAGKMMLKDLPSSTIDTAAAVLEGANAAKETTSSTVSSGTPDSAPTPTPPPSIPPPPKKKLFSLPFLKRKKKEEPVQPVTPPTPAAPQTKESLIKTIDDKLHRINGDEYVTIKMSKQALFILVGIMLLALWISPLVELNLPNVLSKRYELLHLMERKAATSQTDTAAPPSPTPIPLTDLSIRVRMGSNSLDAANEVKGLLTAKGFTHIDMVYDPQVNPKSLLIVTKDANELLQRTLNQVFEGKYLVASEAAALTSDSDFAASILVGKSAKLAQ